jgi:hypothetical protein
MRRNLILLTLLGLLLSATTALAQSGNGYDLSWWTVDGGGHAFSTGGSYALGGTIGQPDAGVMSGGDFALQGGFWQAGAAYEYVYLPLVLRDY